MGIPSGYSEALQRGVPSTRLALADGAMASDEGDFKFGSTVNVRDPTKAGWVRFKRSLGGSGANRLPWMGGRVPFWVVPSLKLLSEKA
jgi:hypothetical protein